jgi:aminoglycoside phosphotransferase (APT) family kinase protein
MALINKIEPQQAQRSLAAWLRTKMDDLDDLVVSDVTVPSSTGKSNETLLFNATWQADGRQFERGLVARVEPTGERMVYTYDLEAEFQVMKALSERTNVPVPAVLFLEQDESVLGARFIVMERAEGLTPGDEPPFPADPSSWVMKLSDSQRAQLYGNAIDVLADLHAADWRELGLTTLSAPGLGDQVLDQHLEYWRDFYAWAMRGQPNPTVEATFEWLEAHRPAAESRPVLTWGDARLGNMMFGVDMTVTAALDWELARMGVPELDLGWWLFCDRHHSEGIGAPWPSGFPSRAETLERYQQRSGHTVSDIDWHEAFGGLRFAILMARAGAMLIDAGALPPDHTMAVNNPGTHLLAKLLDIPAPEGAPSTFMTT